MKYVQIECDKEELWTELGGDDHAIRQIIMELDEDDYAVRQMIVDENNEYHYSCLEDCLAEGQVYEDEMDEKMIDLPSQVFETMWDTVLKQYEKQWRKQIDKYPVGAHIQGILVYNYPQGAIIKGEDFIAVYKGDAPFIPHKEVCYQVLSYDHCNMWLVVGGGGI